jgi:8-oxo-dGTP diphosphatase
VYLVAEADAGKREEWPGPDRLRPITRDGWRQARAVADRLRGQPIERVVASPWLRCRQTVQPLADQLGLDVHDERALAETGDVERAMLVIESLRGTPSVVCTHEDVVRAILGRLGRAPEAGEIGPWLIETTPEPRTA